MSLDIELYAEADLGGPEPARFTVFCWNFTHNAAPMAMAAGFYQELWRPEEVGLVYARELIGPLERGIKDMEEKPEAYRSLQAANGWGTREQFLEALRQLLQVLRDCPGARVSASR